MTETTINELICELNATATKCAILCFDLLDFYGRYVNVNFNGVYNDKLIITVDENPYSVYTPFKGTYDRTFYLTGKELVKDIEEMLYAELCKFYNTDKIKRV